MNKLIALIFMFFSTLAFADVGRNQGAINNLCQNLTNACRQGDKSYCEAAKKTGCLCDQKTGTCTRGNYSN